MRKVYAAANAHPIAARRLLATLPAVLCAHVALGQGPAHYEEKHEKGTTQVTFKADAVSGTGLSTDSVRVLIHSKRTDVRCLGQYDYLTDRSLTGLTLRYAFRATLKCLNPCLTDDDLDYLTSCDDWDTRAERILTLRHAIGPMRERGEATEGEAVEQLLSETVGCNDTQLDKARSEGRISERVFEAGSCKQYNDAFKPKDIPRPEKPLELPKVAQRPDAEIEFSRFRTTILASFLTNQATGHNAHLGGALSMKWHFAGAYNVQAYGGALAEAPLVGLGFYRSASRRRFMLSGGALLIDKGAQRFSVDPGEIGIGIPTKVGSLQVLGSPISYYRDLVNDLAGAETHIKVAVEQQPFRNLILSAQARAGFLFAGGRTTTRAVTEGTQDSLGSRLMGSVGVAIPFRDVSDLEVRFVPSIRLEASYESQRNAISPSELAPSPRADYDVWTLGAGFAGGF